MSDEEFTNPEPDEPARSDIRAQQNDVVRFHTILGPGQPVVGVLAVIQVPPSQFVWNRFVHANLVPVWIVAMVNATTGELTFPVDEFIGGVVAMSEVVFYNRPEWN